MLLKALWVLRSWFNNIYAVALIFLYSRGCCSDYTLGFIVRFHSSVGKESTCNAPVWFLGGGRSAGERIGCPLQYALASLVAQLGKYPPTMRETWVRSLGWEDPLEKRKVTHSSILVWRIPWPTVHGVAKRWTRLSDFHFTFPSWSGIWPIFGRYFVIKFCPTVLGDSFQIRWKFLKSHPRC